MSPAEQVAALLASAEIVRTPFAGGTLHWQRWIDPGSPSPVSALPPLVLVHGGFGSWTHWFRNLPTLRQHREVLTLDLPGLGQSSDIVPPATIAHFAQIILSGLDLVLEESQPFELAGFSFGGMIAGHLASLAGRRCQRLTLIGAVGFGDLQVQVPLLQPPEPGDPKADAIHRENLARLMIHQPSVIDELAIHIHGENLAQSRFHSRRLAVTDELARVLPAIEAPLVGIWGQEDATAGGVAAIEARRALFHQAQPNGHFHMLPGVGHWAMYEATDTINQVLLADLSGLDALG